MRVLDKGTRLPIAAAVVSYTEPAYSDKLQHSIADDNGIALLKRRKGGCAALHGAVAGLHTAKRYAKRRKRAHGIPQRGNYPIGGHYTHR